MKAIRYFLILIFFCFSAKAQIITTIAGGGSGGPGSPATSAAIFNPTGIIFDSHYNLYFTEHLYHRVTQIDTLGIIRRIVGGLGGGYNGDSILATAAQLNQPSGIAFDKNGYLYISDMYNCRIRKVNVSTGVITTYSGNGTCISTGDGGAASAATLAYPQGMCIDEYGNMYIAELNRIRKIDTFGIIHTIAGDGTNHETGDGGAATAARTGAVWVDVDKKGNVYITGIRVVRKINPAGIISTIAGDTLSGFYNGDGIPATSAHLDPIIVKFDNLRNQLLISDGYNDRVRIIDSVGIIRTFAGNGMNGFSGDGGRSDSAKLDMPSGIAFDSCDNVYIGQINTPRIRKVTFDTCLSSIDTGSNPHTVVPEITKSNFNLYPNPVNNQIIITSYEKINTVIITNMLGQIVLKQMYTDQEKVKVNIEDIAIGIYFVKVNGIYVERVVKE